MRKLALLVAFALFACTPAPQPPPVTVPQANPGQSVGLQAVVAQALSCAASSLTWSVQEGLEAGNVTQDGVYTAPPCGSPYVDGPDIHVVAAGCNQTATVAVQVRQKVLAVTITDCISYAMTPDACHVAGASPACATTAGGYVWYYARVDLSCSSSYSPPLPTTWPPACT